MASPKVPDLLKDLLRQADDRVLAGWYGAVSTSAARVRRRLRAAHRPFLDVDLAVAPALEELEATAAWVIHESSARAAAVGGLAGIAGFVSIPPEALANVVSTLRLAQRLAVVYGFDPETDRGRMAVSRALAAGFEVALPDSGPVGMRVSDLPAVVAPGWIPPRTVGIALAARIVRQAVMAVTRPTRVVPLFSAAPSAARGGRRSTEVGDRMARVFSQLAEVPSSAATDVEDAHELEGASDPR